ncbi:hypothetical protein, partial [Marinospirillum perlucidum]|uniref:hypothetical protein n=1 Tax=Marinospirillum perlucidum TaxID=1982602 RepID=UPI001C4990D8
VPDASFLKSVDPKCPSNQEASILSASPHLSSFIFRGSLKKLPKNNFLQTSCQLLNTGRNRCLPDKRGVL